MPIKRMFEMREGVQELNNTPAGAGDNRGCSSSGHASWADLKFFSFASVAADSNADTEGRGVAAPNILWWIQWRIFGGRDRFPIRMRSYVQTNDHTMILWLPFFIGPKAAHPGV